MESLQRLLCPHQRIAAVGHFPQNITVETSEEKKQPMHKKSIQNGSGLTLPVSTFFLHLHNSLLHILSTTPIMTAESKSDEPQLAAVSAVSLSEESVVAVVDSGPAKEEMVEDEVLEKAIAEKKEKEDVILDKKKTEEEEEKEPSSEETEHCPSLGSVLVKKSSSFREESNFLSDLKENERRALLELRGMLEEAILESKLLKFAKEEEEEEVKDAADITLWGVPLLPSRCSESTNVVLLKFLRAREFKVDDAFHMLQSTIRWRKEHNIDAVVDEEDLGGVELEATAYMDGTDRDGHPVCYNVFGAFQDDGLYQRTFGSEEKMDKFLRWRFQLIEKETQKMKFEPGSVASILQVIDLKNASGIFKKELRNAVKKAVGVLQDNYPEFVAKSIFINVPLWYCAVNTLLSPFLTRRTKSKFIFSRSANVTETLLRYIPAEDVPRSYGGLRHPNDEEFAVKGGGVSEVVVVKAGCTESIEIPAIAVGTTVVWDLTVLGWDVNYKEEFVPDDEGSYTVIIQKGRKMAAQEEPIRNSFRNNEPGKIVLAIENTGFKKKRVLFRYKNNI